jgi:hypothetical protein
MSKTPLSKR